MNYDSFQDKHLANYFRQRAVQRNLHRFREAERFENLPTFYKNLSSQYNDGGDCASPSNCLCTGSNQCYFCQSKNRKADLVDSLRPPSRSTRLSLHDYLSRTDALVLAPRRPASSHSSNSRSSSRQHQPTRANSSSSTSRSRFSLVPRCATVKCSDGESDKPLNDVNLGSDSNSAAASAKTSPPKRQATSSPYADKSFRRSQMVNVASSKKHVSFEEKQFKRSSSASALRVTSAPSPPPPPTATHQLSKHVPIVSTETKTTSFDPNTPSGSINVSIVHQQIIDTLASSTPPPRRPPGVPRGPRQLRYDPQLQIQQCTLSTSAAPTTETTATTSRPETFVLLRFTVNQFIKAVVMQRYVRGFLARLRITKQRRAARRIQRAFRKFAARCHQATVTWMFEKQGSTWTSTSSFTQYGGVKSPFHTKKIQVQPEFANEVDLHNDVLTHLSNQLSLLMTEPPKRIEVLTAELTARKILQLECHVIGNEQVERNRIAEEQEQSAGRLRKEYQNVLRSWRYSKVLLLQWHRAQESIQAQQQKLTRSLFAQLQEDCLETEELSSRLDATLEAQESYQVIVHQFVDELLNEIVIDEQVEYATILRDMEISESFVNELENQRERFYHDQYLACLLITTEERRSWDATEKVLLEHKNLCQTVAQLSVDGAVLARAEEFSRTEILSTEFNDFLFLFDDIPVPQFLVEF